MMWGVEFQWTDRSAKSAQIRLHRRDHPDPTADQAIGNVMREERRKQRQERARSSQKHRVGVWHAPEKGEAYAGK